MSTMTLSLHDLLHQHFGTAVTATATINIDELLDAAVDGDEYPIDINDPLARQREIAVIWGVEDVQSVRPDLSEDQSWEVLKFAHRGHDACIGINWESLELAAEALYGFADDAVTAEGGGHE